MNNKIIKNCPSCVNIPNSSWNKNGNKTVEFFVVENYCEAYSCRCIDVHNCLIKEIKQKYNVEELKECEDE